MIYRDNGQRYADTIEWETLLNQPYDYKRKGLVQHILSNRIVNSKNPILQTILKYYEKNIVFLLNYVDALKHFKNYNHYNR